MSVSSAQPVLESDLFSMKGSGEEEDNNSSGHPKRPPSPEAPRCAICLSDVVNPSRSNTCTHQFCFGCLQQWSTVKPECPLCKRWFCSIYHNYRSTTDHDEYVVPGSNYRLLIRMISEARTHNFRQINATSSFTDPAPASPYPLLGSYSSQDDTFRPIMSEHRRAQEEDIQMPGYQNRRRRYDRAEWIQPFGSPLQGVTPSLTSSVEYIRRNPSTTTRVGPWLNRELRVLLAIQRNRLQVHPPNLAWLYDLIMHLINQFDCQSNLFREMVSSHLGERTAHFQHELHHFIVSGLTMEEFDRMAVYTVSRSNVGSVTNPEVTPLSDEGESSPRIASSRRVVTPPPLRQESLDDILVIDSSSPDDGESQPVIESVEGSSHGGTSAHLANSRLRFSNYASSSYSPASPTPRSPPTACSFTNTTIPTSSSFFPTDEHRYGRSLPRDPRMPRLEVQTNVSQGIRCAFTGVRSDMTTDRSRATAAATTTTVTNNYNHNCNSSSSPANLHTRVQPSVVSNGSGAGNSRNELLSVVDVESPPNVHDTYSRIARGAGAIDAGAQDSVDLECLGSFPKEEKPPLAVVTLSSDDEESPGVKDEGSLRPPMPIKKPRMDVSTDSKDEDED